MLGNHKRDCLDILCHNQPHDTDHTTKPTHAESTTVHTQNEGQNSDTTNENAGQGRDAREAPRDTRPLDAREVREVRDGAAEAGPANVHPRARVILQVASKELEAARREEGVRIELVADLVSLNRWSDRPTVQGLMAKWGVPEVEVHRLHRLASVKLAAHRGSRTAQLESSVAHVKEVRDQEKSLAEQYEAEAHKAIQSRDTRMAKLYRLQASSCRTNQMRAQEHLDKLLGLLKTGDVKITVAVQADPDFSAAFRVVAQVLDAEYPGATQVLEAAIAVHEDLGDAGLADWLADRQGNRGALVAVGESVEEPVVVDGETGAGELPTGPWSAGVDDAGEDDDEGPGSEE